MAFGTTPKDVTLIPLGSVAVPGHSGGDLTALEGGPASMDANGNETAPVSMYVKDGGNVTQGSLADAAWAGSGSGSTTAILKKIVAGQTGTATVVQSAGASAGTSWRMAGDYTEVTGQGTGVVTGIGTFLLPETDVSAYKHFSVTLSGTWSLTLIVEVSNTSGANYQTLVMQQPNPSVANFSSITATGTYDAPLKWRYLRIRVSGFSSNASLASTFEFHTLPGALEALNAVQAGTWTVQPGNTANTTPWLVSAGPPADLTLLASAAQTTTQTLADQANFAGKGIRVVLDCTVAGTGSVTLEIDAKDVASGKYIALLTGAPVITISTNVYVIHPELTAAANAIAKDVLPHTWRVKVVANNANTITYSVGSSYLN